MDGLEEPFKAYIKRNSVGSGGLADGTGFDKPKEGDLVEESQ